MNYGTDTVTSLQGTNTTENGIAKGYASGNLTYTADWWNGASNDGEFTVGGTSFTPNKLVIAKKYYYAGSLQVAMRVNGTLSYLLGDHLESTSITTDASGVRIAELMYKAWGEVRFSYGTTPTNFTYTGQYSYTASFGLMYYGARFYDPALSRFAQADTIIPGAGNVGAWDRYAAMLNNPMNLIDPSGNIPVPHPVPGCTRYDADGFCVQGGTGNGWDPEVQLTHADYVEIDYGGDEVKALFDEYNNTPGWWNNYQSGTFTLEAFIGLWALMESNGNPTVANVIATIIAQNLYVGGFNPRTCNSLWCVNGAFNYMAKQSQGTGGLFSGPKANLGYARDRLGPSGKLYNYEDEAHVAKLIFNLGSKALDIGSVVSLDHELGPSNWGNTKYWDETLRSNGIDEGVINGLAKDTVYYYIGNAVYYSVKQYNYWLNKTVMEMEAPGKP